MFFVFTESCYPGTNEALKDWIVEYCQLNLQEGYSGAPSMCAALLDKINIADNVYQFPEDEIFCRALSIELNYYLAQYNQDQYSSFRTLVLSDNSVEQQGSYLNSLYWHRNQALSYYIKSVQHALHIKDQSENAANDKRINIIASNLYSYVCLVMADLIKLAAKASNPDFGLKFLCEADSLRREMLRYFHRFLPSIGKSGEIKRLWVQLLREKGEAHHSVLSQPNIDASSYRRHFFARNDCFSGLVRKLKSDPLLRIKCGGFYDSFCKPNKRLGKKPSSRLRTVFPVKEKRQVPEKLETQPVKKPQQGRYGALEKMKSMPRPSMSLSSVGG